jgi:hypothetical protein
LFLETGKRVARDSSDDQPRRLNQASRVQTNSVHSLTKSTLGCFFVCFFFEMTRRANVSMLGALARRLGKPLRVGTSTALLVGIVAAVASREMSSVVTVRVAPTARVSDLAGARLTKLPVPSVGAATAVQAATLWQDRPAVVLVLRRPG